MAWGMKDIGEQRVRFAVAVSRKEKPMAQLCREFEISRPTGYVWIKRYREQGIAGLEEHSRRPQHSPRQTVEVLEQRGTWGDGTYPVFWAGQTRADDGEPETQCLRKTADHSSYRGPPRPFAHKW
jgi:hypothetical protein